MEGGGGCVCVGGGVWGGGGGMSQHYGNYRNYKFPSREEWSHATGHILQLSSDHFLQTINHTQHDITSGRRDTTDIPYHNPGSIFIVSLIYDIIRPYTNTVHTTSQTTHHRKHTLIDHTPSQRPHPLPSHCHTPSQPTTTPPHLSPDLGHLLPAHGICCTVL